MTDLTERLRHCAANSTDEYLYELTHRSADEIEWLQTRIAELEAALRDIGIYGCGMLSQPIGLNAHSAQWMQKRIERVEQVARAALNRSTDHEAG